MILILSMTQINDMDQHITFPDFIKRGFETFDKVMRKFSDKPDRIRKEKRHPTKYHLSYCCIQGRKKFVFGKNFGFAQKIHQG